MKKLILLVGIAITLSSVSNAQWAGEEKKVRTHRDTEQEGTKAVDFEVRGFVRDKDERDVRVRNTNDDQLNGFDNNAEAKAEKKAKKTKRWQKKLLAGRKSRVDRYKDIELLMLDLNLAKIQKPVFRGILTEHLRDVEAIKTNETLTNVEKNIQLKQVYALRSKRLKETLYDDQYNKWLRIRDEDEYLYAEKPEDY